MLHADMGCLGPGGMLQLKRHHTPQRPRKRLCQGSRKETSRIFEPKIQKEQRRLWKVDGSLLLYSFVRSHGSMLIHSTCVILETAYDHVAQPLLWEVLQEYSVSL